ncbi:MAG: SEC-C domain-containing protein [Chloroflexota bacterium]
MAPKRNDPCHCGSGKKYKHCHLKEDREKERAEKEPVFKPMQAPVTVLPHLIDDDAPQNRPRSMAIPAEMAREMELYHAFEEADYEGQIDVLRTSIDELELDNENAFEFFNELYPQMAERGNREGFVELVALLRTNLPDMYAAEEHWFWEWEVSNALILGDDEALQRATERLVRNGEDEPDMCIPVLNGLFYHDRRGVLLNAITKLTAEIDAGDYFVNESVELNEKFGKLIVLNYMETHYPTGEPGIEPTTYFTESNVEALATQAVIYIEDLTVDGLKQYISRVGGLIKDEWTLEHFDLDDNLEDGFEDGEWMNNDWYNGWGDDDYYDEGEEDDEIAPCLAHLRDLGYEFLHYARHVETIPLTKAELAREHLADYILERATSELLNHPLSKATVNNVLLPDYGSLQEYLPRFYSPMGYGMYAGAALFELVPTWVRFLQSKELVDPKDSRKALKSMQALSQSVVKVMENYDSDPTLAVNMRKWRENAGI